MLRCTLLESCNDSSVSANDHSIGGAAAPVTLVEYADYQCPHCAVADAVVQKLHDRYGDQLRVVFRNFPLTEVHAAAEPAAELAEGAAAQGKFWPMHDASLNTAIATAFPRSG